MLSPHPQKKNENFSNTSKKLFKIETEILSYKCKLEFASSILLVIVGNSCQSAQGTQLNKCGRQNSTEKECKDLGCCYTNSSSLRKNNITWRCVREM